MSAEAGLSIGSRHDGLVVEVRQSVSSTTPSSSFCGPERLVCSQSKLASGDSREYALDWSAGVKSDTIGLVAFEF
jgi:hypothetical protein